MRERRAYSGAPSPMAGHSLHLSSWSPRVHPESTLAAAHPGNGCQHRSEENSSPGPKLRPKHPGPAEASLGQWEVHLSRLRVEEALLGGGAVGGRGREGPQLTLLARGWGGRWSWSVSHS